MAMPMFLGLDHVLRLHRSLIEHYGATGGTHDVGLLQSAIAMPQASCGGEFPHGDIYEMAATYLYHIVQNIRSSTATSGPGRRPEAPPPIAPGP